MREHQSYIEFKKAAIALDLSDTQALELDSAQIKEMAKTGDTKLSENFLANMKSLAVEEIRNKTDLSTLNTVKTLLQQTFPNLQAQIDRDQSGRVITIHLDSGKELKDG